MKRLEDFRLGVEKQKKNTHTQSKEFSAEYPAIMANSWSLFWGNKSNKNPNQAKTMAGKCWFWWLVGYSSKFFGVKQKSFKKPLYLMVIQVAKSLCIFWPTDLQVKVKPKKKKKTHGQPNFFTAQQTTITTTAKCEEALIKTGLIINAQPTNSSFNNVVISHSSTFSNAKQPEIYQHVWVWVGTKINILFVVVTNSELWGENECFFFQWLRIPILFLISFNKWICSLWDLAFELCCTTCKKME